MLLCGTAVAMIASMASTMTSGSDQFTASEWTQRNLLNDVMQQKWLLVGAGFFIGALWLWSRRSAPEEEAARRLVRDLRNVDDPEDARELLGSDVPNLPPPRRLPAPRELQAPGHPR